MLSGGEPAALAIVDATVRLLPGAMSDLESARTDSFWDGSGLSAPSYTRPAEYRGRRVPEVLHVGRPRANRGVARGGGGAAVESARGRSE